MCATTTSLLLAAVALCYASSVRARECAKIDLSSKLSRTATCDANAGKMNGDFFFVCASEEKPANIIDEVSSTCRSLQVILLKTLINTNKSLGGSIAIRIGKNLNVYGRTQFDTSPVGSSKDIWQGLQIGLQALKPRPVDRKIVVVVSYINGVPCLSDSKCKELVEKLFKDKLDVYFVDIDSRKHNRPASEKYFIYDSSSLTNRAIHLPIFGQYAANCICEHLFGAAAASGPPTGNGSLASGPKSASAAEATPKKFTVGKILLIVLPAVVGGLIIIAAIVAVVVYVKKRKASSAKLSEYKSKSSLNSSEKISVSSSQTKKAASPATGGAVGAEKQPESGGRQRKVDDYLLLSAHTADKSKKV